MKKVLLIVLYFLSTVIIFAKDRESVETKWFIGPSVGVSWGEFGEYLYDSSDTYVCSKLLWEAKPLYNVGLNAGVERGKFLFEISQDFSLPFSCGKMYDSDFEKDLCFNYSINENQNIFSCNSALVISYDLFSFPIFETSTKKQKITFSPALKLQFNYNKMKAQNGYGFYGSKEHTNLSKNISWNNDNAKYYDVGQLSNVELTYNSFHTFGGFTICYNIEKISFFISAFTSLYSYSNVLDIHNDDFSKGREKYLTSSYNTFFLDTLFYFKTNIKVKNNLELSALVNYYKSVTGKENTYFKGYYDENNYFSDFEKLLQKSCFSLYDLSFCFNIKYIF